MGGGAANAAAVNDCQNPNAVVVAMRGLYPAVADGISMIVALMS